MFVSGQHQQCSEILGGKYLTAKKKIVNAASFTL